MMPETFAPETPVRVCDRWPESQGSVHIRTPHYLRGIEGRVVRCLGTFANPEDLAFGRSPTIVPLYHVIFASRSVWPDAEPHDLLVEIFEHWLEPAP